MFNGIMAGHEANQEIVEFIKGMRAEIGKPKFDYPSNEPDPEMSGGVMEFAIEDLRAALDTDDKTVRDERLKPDLRDGARAFRRCIPSMRGQDRRVPL